MVVDNAGNKDQKPRHSQDVEAMTDSGTSTKKGGLRWHWVWFLPLCVLVLLTSERHTVVFGFAALKLF